MGKTERWGWVGSRGSDSGHWLLQTLFNCTRLKAWIKEALSENWSVDNNFV